MLVARVRCVSSVILITGVWVRAYARHGHRNNAQSFVLSQRRRDGSCTSCTVVKYERHVLQQAPYKG